MQWTGVAVLLTGEGHSSRPEGYIGGFAAVACEGDDIVEAVDRLSRELDENSLILLGFENFLVVEMLDRELTAEEKRLTFGLKNYPVQFSNVHLHKGDA
jgi:hypothetical protein